MTALQRGLWEKLRNRVLRVTRDRGRKTALALRLHVSRQLLYAWLSGTALPTAENTLQLLKWVEAEEAEQQKRNPGRAGTRPGRKTRKRKSTINENPRSNRK